jgi:hypothetical protein
MYCILFEVSRFFRNVLVGWVGSWVSFEFIFELKGTPYSYCLDFAEDRPGFAEAAWKAGLRGLWARVTGTGEM